MHPDSPIRQLDEMIRRYGVTCLELVPFEGGYCVRIGSSVEPVNVGAGSLSEAIGKAFLKLIELRGGPSFEKLLDASSLGTPEAKALRASADPAAVKKVLDRVHTHENPAVHWPRSHRSGYVLAVPLSACGLVRGGGTHAKFASLLKDVTCGRCQHSTEYRVAYQADLRRRRGQS